MHRGPLVLGLSAAILFLPSSAFAAAPAKPQASLVKPVSQDWLPGIKQLLAEKKFDEAYSALDEIARKNSRDYLPRAFQAYVADKHKPLIYTIDAAKAAARLGGKQAWVQTNYGIALQKDGRKSDAIGAYRAATVLDSSAWRARLGIAQCLAVDGSDGRLIAEEELKLASASPDNSREKWFLLGQTYMTLRQFKEAARCFDRLLALGIDYEAKALRLKAALSQEDKSQDKLIADVLSNDLSDQELAILLSELPEERLNVSKKEELLSVCERNFVGSDELFYAMGRRLDDHYVDLAYRAYQDALKYAPQSGRYMLSLIGNRAQAGDSAELNKLTVQFCPTGEKPKRYRDAFSHTLQYVPDLVSGAGTLSVFKAVYHHINCGCRLAVIEYKLRTLDGVIFANLLDMKEPPLTVIYDRTVKKADTILSTVLRPDDKLEVLSDEPVQSLSAVVKLIQKASDKPDKHIFTIWSFAPASMEFPK